MDSFDSGSGKEKKGKFGPPGSWSIMNSLILIIFFVFMIYFFRSADNTKVITQTEFEKLITSHQVERIVIVNKEYAEVYLKKDTANQDARRNSFTSELPAYKFNIGSPEVFEAKLHRIQSEIASMEQVKVEYKTKKNWLWTLMIWFLPFLVIFFLARNVLKGIGKGAGSTLFSFGQSGARLFEKDKKVNISFKDVAGLDEAKQEMEETVDFLKNPQTYTKLGAKIPKGILLVGPPGTGKTLLAKAVAGEAQVSFLSLSGSEFVEMFVGIGASRVRDLFKKAKEKSPCIIFIDEIDAIGRSRGKMQSMGSNDERENTLNQLLTEMDGFSTNSGVIVLAATNRGEILDRALLRPGRFDRHIYLELPDSNERREIFTVHMKPLVLDDTVDLDLLSAQTPGFSGADIANVCNEAALIAARRKKLKIGKDEFSDAMDRVVGGLEKRKKLVSPKEREIVAIHEAGHALATCYLKGINDIIKVSIIPRGKSLGVNWYRPEELQLITLSHLLNDISVILAGRAAEEVVFGEITSGALDDLEKVTKMAYSMIAYYGLGKKLGNVSFYDSTGNQEGAFQKPYSEETAKIIDEEVRKLISDCYNKVVNLVSEHKNELKKIGALLLEKEVIYKEDIDKIIND